LHEKEKGLPALVLSTNHKRSERLLSLYSVLGCFFVAHHALLIRLELSKPGLHYVIAVRKPHQPAGGAAFAGMISSAAVDAALIGFSNWYAPADDRGSPTWRPAALTIMSFWLIPPAALLL